MIRVLFRVDASKYIGSGHVIRCRTLARSLLAYGVEIIFISRVFDGNLIFLLSDEFQVIQLPNACDQANSIKPQNYTDYSNDYDKWLGCSQEFDAAQTISYLKLSGISSADWLVVDHYSLDSTWETKVSQYLSPSYSARCSVLAIDDLANRCHSAQLLLDQNFYAEFTEHRYTNLICKSCKPLLGPNYALLSNEYSTLHNLIPIRTSISRVIIYFGGVDADNNSLIALKAFDCQELAHICVDVILGIQNPNHSIIQEVTDSLPHATLFAPQPSLAPLIARADLSIGAGGSTSWERACLGLPSIVYSLSENQEDLSQSAHDHGFIELLENPCCSRHIRNSVINFMSNPTKLSTMSSIAHQMCDGAGSNRVAELMLHV
jgi:UDP-2,4-diacetamido-2,4,6-trideoxy-beta-L-altropyranose hydrolase